MRVEDIPNDSEEFAANVNHNMVPVHVKNCFNNYELFKKEFGTRIVDVPHGKKLGKAVIIGSGQTLDGEYENLRRWQQENHGIIVCSSSQISTLYYHGIKPEICVVFDVKTTEDMFFIEEIDYEYTTLLIHPGVPFEIVKNWKGNIYTLLLTGGNDFNSYIKHAYDFVEMQTMPFATAFATQMIFTIYMGFAPLFLVGCDMQGDRFLRYYYQDGEWKSQDWRKDEEGKNVIEDGDFKTSQAMIYHKKGLLSAYRVDLVSGGYPMFNCSKESIIREIPYLQLADVMEDPLAWTKHEWSPKIKCDIIDRFLAYRFTHVMTAHNGYNWITKVLVGGSEQELTKKFHEMNNDITNYKKQLIAASKREGKTLKELSPKFDVSKIKLIDIPEHWKRIKELQASEIVYEETGGKVWPKIVK